SYIDFTSTVVVNSVWILFYHRLKIDFGDRKYFTSLIETTVLSNLGHFRKAKTNCKISFPKSFLIKEFTY
ncbi:hypothetical protein, partial [Plesiomonas shigelloides]|uniref:hypothetical protein n=1 Tax=Plesiomonas shigelloides TaxID=703 RepID=UPI001E401144